MKGKWIGFLGACAVLAAWGATVQADPPPLTLWTTQIGSTEWDEARGIAVDGAGNSYITGWTKGDLGGPNQGDMDAFIVACDSGGTVQWTRQIGTIESDWGCAIAVDGSGNSYITGPTRGDLGGASQGERDAFIVKSDSAGTVQWTRQIGTIETDWGSAIAIDGSGNSYITGMTSADLGGPNQGWEDAFIVKYDSGGTVQWMRQIGSTDRDYGQGIAVDSSGNSYITGYTTGDLGGPNQGYRDAFIVACDSGGTVQWARQIGGSGWDEANAIAVDGSGNSYITGRTDGDLAGPNPGGFDAFIVKYDSGGTEQWSRQIGTTQRDEAHGIAVDGSGNIYVTGGQTGGDQGGANEAGWEAFIVAYDSAGTQQWIRQLGTSSSDLAYGIAVGGSGNIYITGCTYGDLGGQVDADAFIVAIGTTPATAGDATLDGCVDGLDYVVWSNNYKTGKWWEEGDFTGDGTVDGLDYIAWSNNYKVGCPAAVPEPASALVLALGLFFVRKRSSA